MKKGEHTGAFRISGFPPLFILAALLLALSTVTGAYALLTHYSQVYTAQIETASMGITLLENGSTAASQNYSEKKRGWEGEQYPLMENLPQQSDGFIQLGRAYPEVLSVQNSGAISAYVQLFDRLLKGYLDGSLSASDVEMAYRGDLRSRALLI